VKEAIEVGEGGAVRRDVRASSKFREAEQLVSPVDFMELTRAQIRTFFSSMLYYLKKRPDLPYAQLTCEISSHLFCCAMPQKVEMPLQIAASGSPPLASFCQAIGLGLGLG
jgi:hypothetical protein